MLTVVYFFKTPATTPTTRSKSPPQIIEVSPKIIPKKPTPQPKIQNVWNEESPFFWFPMGIWFTFWRRIETKVGVRNLHPRREVLKRKYHPGARPCFSIWATLAGRADSEGNPSAITFDDGPQKSGQCSSRYGNWHHGCIHREEVCFLYPKQFQWRVGSHQNLFQCPSSTPTVLKSQCSDLPRIHFRSIVFRFQ